MPRKPSLAQLEGRWREEFFPPAPQLLSQHEAKLSLAEGYKRLDQRLKLEGFERCPDQLETPEDGDCGIWVLLRRLQHLQQVPGLEHVGLDSRGVQAVRELVAQGLPGLVREGAMVWPWEDSHMALWTQRMARRGTFVDNIWLQVMVVFAGAFGVTTVFQAFALLAGPSLVIVPTLATSGTRPHGVTMVQGSNIHMAPIFLGYLEETIYTSGHFQAIQPAGGNIPIMEFLQGEAKITAKDQSKEDKMKDKLAENEMETKMTWVDILFPDDKDGEVKVGPKTKNINKANMGKQRDNCGMNVDECKQEWTEVKHEKKTKYLGKNKEISYKKVDTIKENKIDNNKKTLVSKEMEKQDSHKKGRVAKKKRFLTKVTCLHITTVVPLSEGVLQERCLHRLRTSWGGARNLLAGAIHSHPEAHPTHR